MILANITSLYGISGLQIATLLAGFILFFMGILKLGNVVKYIPNSVIVGFTSGIAFIIFVGEWKDFFGLTIHSAINLAFYQKFWLLFKNIYNLNVPTTLLGISSLILEIVKTAAGSDVLALVTTFLLTIFGNLVIAVFIGVLLATTVNFYKSNLSIPTQ